MGETELKMGRRDSGKKKGREKIFKYTAQKSKNASWNPILENPILVIKQNKLHF